MGRSEHPDVKPSQQGKPSFQLYTKVSLGGRKLLQTNSDSKRVLITGITGMIGSAVAEVMLISSDINVNGKYVQSTYNNADLY